MKKITYILALTFVSIAFVTFFNDVPQNTANIAHAALDSYTLLEPLPCVEGSGQECVNGMVQTVNVKTYLSYIFLFMLAFATMAAVIRIMAAGIQYMLTDVVFKKGESKKAIQNAVYGLLLTLSSYLILRTIDPQLVSFTGTLPPVQVASTTRNIFLTMDQKLTIELGQIAKIAREEYLGLEERRTSMAERAEKETDPEKKAIILEDIRKIEVEQVKVWITPTVNQSYVVAREEIKNSKIDVNTFDIYTETQKKIEALRDKIRINYGEAILKTNRLGEYALASRYEKERIYYITSIEQELLARKISFSEVSPKQKEWVASYKSFDVNNRNFLSGAPDLLEKYEKDAASRMEMIKKAVGDI